MKNRLSSLLRLLCALCFLLALALVLTACGTSGSDEKDTAQAVEKNRYETAVLTEGIYPLGGVRAVTVYKNTLYSVRASKNAVYACPLPSDGTAPADITENAVCLYRPESGDIPAALDTDGGRLWVLSENGSLAALSPEDGTVLETRFLPGVADVRGQLRVCGKNVLFAGFLPEYDDAAVGLYLFDTESGTCTSVRTLAGVGECMVRGYGFLDADRIVFAYEEMRSGIPLGREGAVCVSLSEKKAISRTDAVSGVCALDCTRETGRVSLLSDSGVSVWEPDTGAFSAQSGTAKRDEAVMGVCAGFFDAGDGYLSFYRETRTDNVQETPVYDGTLQVVTARKTDAALCILFPGDGMRDIDDSVLRVLLSDFQTETGEDVTVEFLPAESYLDKLRLRLLEKDGSFDLYFLPAAEEDGILSALMGYGLYRPVNAFPETFRLFENSCCSYVRTALTDGNGALVGVPLSVYAEVFCLTDAYTSRFGDTLTYEGLLSAGETLLREGGGALFYSEYDALNVFLRMEQDMLAEHASADAEKELVRLLTAFRRFAEGKVLCGSQYLIGSLPLMNAGNGSALYAYTPVPVPSYRTDDAGISVRLGSLFLANPFAGEERAAPADRFLSFVTAHIHTYAEGFVSREPDGYLCKDIASREYGQPFFALHPEYRPPYEEIDACFPRGDTVLFEYPDGRELFFSVLRGEVTPEQAARDIRSCFRRWAEE